MPSLSDLIEQHLTYYKQNEKVDEFYDVINERRPRVGGGDIPDDPRSTRPIIS